ncbi:unnamed protein product (macronuclear) [Paramecium tetraurelia]|uniref:Uncharacterized protein n=1 Tax=Paramecium tetraurelia TaxID=5888 RepID=A0BTK2_PARTE|nr:uncharacterized protein GSPATT00032101001 [Paramecium tetraurelia]CAK61869.1 unnamed protein product [Paramecium tetraurelia]|eukprot:XP_001429267.1 hypothetical protein (macronuclear) [Paramecium tetraurelia strain d4-2]
MGLCQSTQSTLKLPRIPAQKHIQINFEKIKEYEIEYARQQPFTKKQSTEGSSPLSQVDK